MHYSVEEIACGNTIGQNLKVQDHQNLINYNVSVQAKWSKSTHWFRRYGAEKALCNLWSGAMEWSWSGVLEWHFGVKFWSGMYSEFEFFVVHRFFIILTVNIHKAN